MTVGLPQAPDKPWNDGKDFSTALEMTVEGMTGKYTKKAPGVARRSGLRRTAATYSPNWWVSTIGDGELNFSVRNGKRWILTAIATAIYF